MVKLTAQFVARNGRQFLTSLMQKEQRNYQFDFLRPQHALFQYFTRLLEQYTKVLIPPKDLMQKLSLESENENEIKKQVSVFTPVLCLKSGLYNLSSRLTTAFVG